MKLIYAGASSTFALDHTNFVYNCTRNPQCQKPFFVPVVNWSDLLFYADLPFGKPTTINAVAVNLCSGTTISGSGDFDPIDFDGADFDTTGGGTTGTYLQEYPLVFTEYLVGQKPDGTWFAVLGAAVPTIPAGVTIPFFFIKITINTPSASYIFYTEEFSFTNDCEKVALLKGCYPNETIGSYSSDMNGIYYGIAVNSDYLGRSNFRYIHWAYVRDPYLYESKVKMEFTLFNSLKPYKNVVNRETVLEFQAVPEFYADQILGIYARGIVKVNGIDHRLIDSPDFSPVDSSSKLWHLDATFSEQIKNFYGCGEADCALPPLRCTDVPVNLVYSFASGIHTFHFTDGDLNPANETIEWKIYTFDGSLITSGVINNFPLTFTINNSSFALDMLTNCYLIQWRKVCFGEAFTTYNSWNIGACPLNGCCRPQNVRAFVN